MDTNILQSEKVKKLVVWVLAVLVLFLASKTVTEIIKYKSAADANNAVVNAITVNGTGEVFAVADIASFSFSVTEEAKTVAEAQKKATEKNNKAIKFLRDKKIEERDIKTTNYSVNPKYDYGTNVIAPCGSYGCPPSKQPTIVGYEVSQSITVKIRNDVDKAGDILTGIGATGVSNISGLSFTIDDEEILKAEARKKAIESAKMKAQVLAKDLGIKLGKVTSFYENNEPIYYGSKMGMGGASDSTVSAPVPEVPRGENKIVVNVSVTYKIK